MVLSEARQWHHIELAQRPIDISIIMLVLLTSSTTLEPDCPALHSRSSWHDLHLTFACVPGTAEHQMTHNTTSGTGGAGIGQQIKQHIPGAARSPVL